MAINNILILGIGGIGMYLAKRLIQDGCTVTIIEPKSELVRRASEILDARIIEGSAMEPYYWKLAYADKMDLLIAVTNDEAINMISSLIADRFGIPKKVVRMCSLEFAQEDSLLKKEDLKIDLAINPNELVAQEIVRLVKRASANDIMDICGGEMKVIAIRAHEKFPLLNKNLKEISQLYPDICYRIVAIARGITTIIPHGSNAIQPNDQVFILIKSSDVSKFLPILGIKKRDIHHLMIIGGGFLGIRIAQLLEKNVDVKLFEKDEKRAQILASTLENTQVLCGDGSNANELVMAGLLDMDTFIATTEDNETNIISCLLAKHLMNRRNRDPQGTSGKTIAIVNKEDYLVLSSTIGLDIALNAKISAANEILKFIRRGELISVVHLHGIDAEVVELVAAPNSLITKKPLRKLNSFFERGGMILGGVFRDGEWEIAIGDTQVKSGERVILICTSLNLKEVQKLFL